MYLSSTDLWGWEIGALLASFASAVAIAALMYVNNGKPVWDQHGVTLNALISVLATTSKTTMMFATGEAIGQWKWLLFSRQPRPLMDMERIDAASRGPLGSVQLLWPKRNFSLLPLGGFLTVLALAMDPFTQQLIQTELRLQNTTEAATIFRAQRYSRGSYSYDNEYASNGTHLSATMDFAMESAILNGLASPYDLVSQQAPYDCKSRNCTFETFESLAICSTCNRVDDLISYTGMSWLYYVTQGAYNDAEFGPNGTTMQVPNGLLINNWNGAPISKSSGNLVLMSTYGTSNASKTNTLKDIDTLIWGMTIMKWTPTESGKKWPDAPVEATECGLYYCVKRFEAQVMNGVLYESESHVNAPRDPKSWGVLYGNVPAQSMDSFEYNTTSAVVRYDLRLGDEFNISQAAVSGMDAYFRDSFKVKNDISQNLTLRQGNSVTNDSDLVTVNGWGVDKFSAKEFQGVQFSPRTLRPFYDTADLGQTFKTLAKSMTNALRSGADNGTFVHGTSQVVTTYYRIMWPWIALHVFMVIAGVAFVMVTVFKTNIQDVPAWKSHSLAPLSRYDEIGNVLVGIDSIARMETTASRYHVSLLEKR